jgi:hypothetical protein
MSTAPKVDKKQLADDLKTILKGKIDDSTIANILKGVPEASNTAYPATGSVASLVFYVKCQCTITGGKTFNGSIWGLAFPGGGALFGDVYTDNISALYANTTSFVLTATPVYTAFYFNDKYGNGLGSFQAGSVSTVVGGGGGGGYWE